MGNEVKKENHSKGLVIAILIIFVEIVVGFIAYNKTISNNEKDNIQENTQENQIENNKDNTEEVDDNKNDDAVALYNGNKGDKYYLYENKYLNSDADEYEYEYSSYSEAELKENNSSNKYNKIGEYICKHDGCDVLSVVNKKYAIVYDKEYFIYNTENNKIIKYLKLDKIKYHDLKAINSKEDEIVGIILSKRTYNSDTKEYNYKEAYYDVKNEKIIIDYGTYDTINSNPHLIEENLILGNIYKYEDYTGEVFNIKDNQIIKKGIHDFIEGDDVIYYVVYGYMKEIFLIEKIYDENFNIIFETKNEEEMLLSDDYYITKDDKLVFTDHNKFYIYGRDYKLEYTSREFDNIEAVFKDYILVTENDYLKLFDYKGNEKAQFCELTKDNYVHSSLSGWYTENGKNGIYVVVETLNSSEEKNGYEYYYIPSTGETGKIATEVGGYAKPVLYLYPENDNTKVKVEFEKPELLTTTYPKYINDWSVIANKNGDLKDTKGKYYYGLYWEEKGNTKVDFKEGFYVEKESAIKFLEEKLDAIGLNEREANEFIMYWLPILEKNEKNLVYFELTEERQKFNRIDISPKPDSLLRIAIHVKKVDTKRNIKPQKFTKFKRSGFTAIEWGGTIH